MGFLGNEFLVEFLSVAQLRLLGLAAPHLAVPELDFWLQFLLSFLLMCTWEVALMA